MSAPLQPFSFEPVVQAVQTVNSRLHRTSAAMKAANLAHAFTDDNAVAAWVEQVDSSAIRNTPDATVILSRADFYSAQTAMVPAGFVPSELDPHLFLDDPSQRRGVRFLFAGEPIPPANQIAHPEPGESELVGSLRVLSLPTLVRIKLATFRDVDRLNLRDLIDVGLIDASWPAKYPTELAARLQHLFDTPGG